MFLIIIHCTFVYLTMFCRLYRQKYQWIKCAVPGCWNLSEVDCEVFWTGMKHLKNIFSETTRSTRACLVCSFLRWIFTKIVQIVCGPMLIYPHHLGHLIVKRHFIFAVYIAFSSGPLPEMYIPGVSFSHALCHLILHRPI